MAGFLDRDAFIEPRRNQRILRRDFVRAFDAARTRDGHRGLVPVATGADPRADGSADLRHVLEVARTIGRLADGPRIVVNKSTVPVGTADRVRAVLRESSEHDFAVVSNPEFLKEGTAVDDFMKPDRIVVGTDDAAARETMEALYAPFIRTGNPIHFMDARSSEMTKYAANAMLATRITFMNEIANLCERVGANVDEVRIGIGSDRRIGPAFLFAGIIAYTVVLIRQSRKESLASRMAAPMLGASARFGNLALAAGLFVPFGGRQEWAKNSTFKDNEQFPLAADGVQRLHQEACVRQIGPFVRAVTGAAVAHAGNLVTFVFIPLLLLDESFGAPGRTTEDSDGGCARPPRPRPGRQFFPCVNGFFSPSGQDLPS